jgi:hypothetical protein
MARWLLQADLFQCQPLDQDLKAMPVTGIHWDPWHHYMRVNAKSI